MGILAHNSAAADAASCQRCWPSREGVRRRSCTAAAIADWQPKGRSEDNGKSGAIRTSRN